MSNIVLVGMNHKTAPVEIRELLAVACRNEENPLLLLPHLVHGFHVPGFWSALFGSIILSVITALFSGWDRRTSRSRQAVAPQRNDVIDI